MSIELDKFRKVLDRLPEGPWEATDVGRSVLFWGDIATMRNVIDAVVDFAEASENWLPDGFFDDVECDEIFDRYKDALKEATT